jgi:hypothetical protein
LSGTSSRSRRLAVTSRFVHGCFSDRKIDSCLACRPPAPITPHPPSLRDGRDRSCDGGERMTPFPICVGCWSAPVGFSAISISIWCSSGLSGPRGKFRARCTRRSACWIGREPSLSCSLPPVWRVTRHRIHALPRGRGVLRELIANRVLLRVADLGAHSHSCGFPARLPPLKTFWGFR